jgi:Domain of Unknown function (DUF542)
MSHACRCHHDGPATGGGTCARDAGIAPETTIEAIGQRSPRALATLRGFGIDTCCGGRLTLAEAAASAGVPVETLLRAVGEGGGGETSS